MEERPLLLHGSADVLVRIHCHSIHCASQAHYFTSSTLQRPEQTPNTRYQLQDTNLKDRYSAGWQTMNTPQLYTPLTTLPPGARHGTAQDHLTSQGLQAAIVRHATSQLNAMSCCSTCSHQPYVSMASYVQHLQLHHCGFHCTQQQPSDRGPWSLLHDDAAPNTNRGNKVRQPICIICTGASTNLPLHRCQFLVWTAAARCALCCCYC